MVRDLGQLTIETPNAIIPKAANTENISARERGFSLSSTSLKANWN